METLARDSNGSRLTEQFGLERPILACPISEPGLFPTVGIEIEVPWHVELPKPADSLMRENFIHGGLLTTINSNLILSLIF